MISVSNSDDDIKDNHNDSKRKVTRKFSILHQQLADRLTLLSREHLLPKVEFDELYSLLIEMEALKQHMKSVKTEAGQQAPNYFELYCNRLEQMMGVLRDRLHEEPSKDNTANKPSPQFGGSPGMFSPTHSVPKQKERLRFAPLFHDTIKSPYGFNSDIVHKPSFANAAWDKLLKDTHIMPSSPTQTRSIGPSKLCVHKPSASSIHGPRHETMGFSRFSSAEDKIHFGVHSTKSRFGRVGSQDHLTSLPESSKGSEHRLTGPALWKLCMNQEAMRQHIALQSLINWLMEYRTSLHVIHPKDLLNCSYLRLNHENVEELEKQCVDLGVPCPMHPHLTVQQVLQRFQDNYNYY